MIAVSHLLSRLEAGTYDDRLRSIYCTGNASSAKRRIRNVTEGYLHAFDAGIDAEVGIYSAPGRTEIGGNHTDHQHGCVLAASVNLDVLACAAPNSTDTIRIVSEGYPMEIIDLAGNTPVEAEKNSSSALIRGVAAQIRALGHPVRGFDAYMVSDVLGGSGLSSSAAYEVMLGVIMNDLFCGGALTAVQIAQIGQYAENVFFGKPCGLMDQTASAVGGAVAIDFRDPANPVIQKIPVDLAAHGCALCIIDSGADHADLTDEYAAIPVEMKEVAAYFHKDVLREVNAEAFYAAIPQLRRKAGDRAVLRAIHFFEENSRAQQEAAALEANHFEEFLHLVTKSGQSSFMYLQNVFCCSTPREQAVSVALAIAGHVLGDAGAYRVHGGGFAGTLQAFVPLDKLDRFQTHMEAVLGAGMCHVLSIRPEGGIPLIV